MMLAQNLVVAVKVVKRGISCLFGKSGGDRTYQRAGGRA